MSFIRRYGTKSGVKLARNEVPDSLRVGFVNLLEKHRYDSDFLNLSVLHDNVCRALRMRPYHPSDAFKAVEYAILTRSWDEFYEICEIAAKAIPVDMMVTPGPGPGLQPTRFVPNPTLGIFVEDMNEMLSEEGAPWRIAERQVVPVFPEEVERVLDDASAAVEKLERPGVAAHLRKARQHLSPSSGDLENAVKEAVSAVEAAVKEKAGMDDFDRALRLLKQQRRLKPHWSSSIQTLFHYASEEDQVRHGSPELSELTYEEARDVVGLAAILTQHIAGLPDSLRAG